MFRGEEKNDEEAPTAAGTSVLRKTGWDFQKYMRVGRYAPSHAMPSKPMTAIPSALVISCRKMRSVFLQGMQV